MSYVLFQLIDYSTVNVIIIKVLLGMIFLIRLKCNVYTCVSQLTFHRGLTPVKVQLFYLSYIIHILEILLYSTDVMFKSYNALTRES